MAPARWRLWPYITTQPWVLPPPSSVLPRCARAPALYPLPIVLVVSIAEGSAGATVESFLCWDEDLLEHVARGFHHSFQTVA